MRETKLAGIEASTQAYANAQLIVTFRVDQHRASSRAWLCHFVVPGWPGQGDRSAARAAFASRRRSGVATRAGRRPKSSRGRRLHEETAMRKESKILHAKAVDSLVLAVDHFNRCWDRGRVEAVLILLDRAFELLLKAIIIHRGGEIREKKKEGTTIGFDLCLRKCLSDANAKCLSEDDAVALQNLNTAGLT